MTTPNPRQEFLRLLDTDEEFRNEVRRRVLTDELLDLPQRFAEFAEWTRQNIEMTNAAIKELQKAVLAVQDATRAMQDQNSVTQGRLGNLIGREYERRLGLRIIPKLSGMLQTRGKRVLKNPEGFNLEFEDLINDALDRNLITENDYIEILLSDFIIGARDFTTHRETLVAEASVTVDTDDVRRARRRANVVAKAVQAPALAAVVGQSINAAAQAMADSQSVLYLEIPEQ